MVSKTLLRNLDFIVGVMGSWGGLNLIISFILLENFNSAILPYQDLNLPWCLGSCSACSVYFLNLLNWTIYWLQACILIFFFIFSMSLHLTWNLLENRDHTSYVCFLSFIVLSTWFFLNYIVYESRYPYGIMFPYPFYFKKCFRLKCNWYTTFY